MQNNQTFFSKIPACLAMTTMAAGFVWFFAAFMEAEKPVMTASLPVIWFINLAVYAANTFILRKERPVWVPAAADAVIGAALFGIVNVFVYGNSLKVSILIVMCILTGALMQVYWEFRGFSDESLVHISQLLLAEAAVQFAAAEYLDTERTWAMWTAGFAAVCLLGALSAKHSGMEPSGSPRPGRKIFSSAGSAGILIITGAAAFLAARPVSRAVRWLFDMAAKAVRTVIGAVYNVLAWLSDMMKPKLTGDFEDEYGYENSERFEEVEYGELDPELAKAVFIVLLAAIAVVFLFAVWKFLSRKGRAKRTSIKASSRVPGQKEGIIGRIGPFVKELIISIRARAAIARHPGSMAAILMKLEKSVYLNPALRRKKGETAREFIIRLAEHMKKTGNEELSCLLGVFADEFDDAFYGRERNVLREFPQHKKMLKTLKNSLTPRV